MIRLRISHDILRLASLEMIKFHLFINLLRQFYTSFYRKIYRFLLEESIAIIKSIKKPVVVRRILSYVCQSILSMPVQWKNQNCWTSYGMQYVFAITVTGP